MPRAGSGVVKIDALRFLAGCHTRQLSCQRKIKQSCWYFHLYTVCQFHETSTVTSEHNSLQLPDHRLIAHDYEC